MSNSSSRFNFNPLPKSLNCRALKNHFSLLPQIYRIVGVIQYLKNEAVCAKVCANVCCGKNYYF